MKKISGMGFPIYSVHVEMDINHYSWENLKKLVFLLDAFIRKASTSNKEDAIILGAIVRILKIGKSFLKLSGQMNLTGQMSLTRLSFETMTNVGYLIRSKDSKRYIKYYKNGLKSEQALLKKIESNIEKRGKIIPIEERMISSIKSTAEKADMNLTEVRSIPKPKEIKFPNVRDRSLLIDPSGNLYTLYKSSSSEIHGDFNNIVKYDINFDTSSKSFIPVLDDNYADTRIINGMAKIIVILINIILDTSLFINSNLIQFSDPISKNMFLKIFEKTKCLINKSEQIHEDFLESR
ncbi:hypothetical protein FCS83_09865 [Oenococcus sp. UCMA 17063]|nr:hypothetical protein [Oenococcus sp. UCMA 17063]